MEMQISYRVCTKVPTKDHLWKDKERDREDTTDAMRKERGRDHRSRGVSRPYTHAGEHTAYSVSEFMGYLKGKSSPMIFDKFANMKYRYGSRQFWCRGYYVDTVGRNKKAIEEYIRNQLKEDKEYEQLTMKELFDPFTGEPVTRDKR